MNKVKITITGAGGTFGVITKAIELLLKQVGANVDVQLDHPTATVPITEAERMVIQVKGRDIVIETVSEPWGG
jgi:hypothetical protein